MNVKACEIIGRHMFQDEPACRFPSSIRNRHPCLTSQIAGRQRIGLEQGVHIARKHHLPALLTARRPHFNNGIGSANGCGIVLHNKDTVAAIFERAQGCQKSRIVSRMQSNGGFIEHIGHPHQAGTKLRGQTDTLGLASRKGHHRTRKRQILQPHFPEKLQSCLQFFINRGKDLLSPTCEGTLGKPVELPLHRHPAELGDIQIINPNGKSLCTQSLATAIWAAHGIAKTPQFLPPAVAILHALLEQSHNTRPARERNGNFFLSRLRIKKMRTLDITACSKGNIAPQPIATKAKGAVCRPPLLIFTVKERCKRFLTQLIKRGIQTKAKTSTQSLKRRKIAFQDLLAGKGKQCPVC